MIGGGGGSAYGIGGAGAFFEIQFSSSGLAKIQDAVLDFVVAEGGSVPHG